MQAANLTWWIACRAWPESFTKLICCLLNLLNTGLNLCHELLSACLKKRADQVVGSAQSAVCCSAPK